MAYKLMVVDDEYPIRQGLATGIDWNSLGFELCAVASNGKETLEIISSNIPDVLITDIRMPVMDGIELIENLSLIYPQIKIVILSGYGEFEYAQKAIEYCVSAYLLKPINNEDLLKVFGILKAELDIKRDIDNSIGRNQIESGDEGLREFYLRELITGSLGDISSLSKAYEKLNVDIFDDYMFAAIFALNFDKPTNSLGQLIEKLNYYSQVLGYPFVYYNKYIYTLISCKNKPGKKYALEKVVQIKAYFEDKISRELLGECIISAGIGSMVSGIKSFPKSCQEAVAAVQAKFYTGLGETINYSDISGNIASEIDRNSFKAVSEELENCVLEGKSNEIISKIKTLFNGVFAGSYCNVNQLAIRSMEVYLAILIRIKESMLEIKASNEDEVFADLSRSETLKEFMNKFDGHLKYIASQISEIKNMQENTLTLRIKKHVEENYENKLTLKEIAEHFSLNASYLSAYFKKNTGVNLFEYILKVRMDKAKDFLKYSDDQVTIIAEKVGFQDYRYFCKTFKKETGVTPLQFRLKNYI